MSFRSVPTGSARSAEAHSTEAYLDSKNAGDSTAIVRLATRVASSIRSTKFAPRSEIPGLNRRAEAHMLKFPGNPLCPGAIDACVAHEEVDCGGAHGLIIDVNCSGVARRGFHRPSGRRPISRDAASPAFPYVRECPFPDMMRATKP